MANLLGNQGNGVYSVAYGIYTITLTLSSMSLPTAVSKVVSARLAREEGRNASRVLAMALLFALVMGTFSLVCSISVRICSKNCTALRDSTARCRCWPLRPFCSRFWA